MTDERDTRIKKVLSKRQPDLTIVFENVDDPHNISACLRSCDSVGIQEVYIISKQGKAQSKLGKKSSASASKWITVNHFHETAPCFEHLKSRGFSIFTTRLEKNSIQLYDLDLTQPVALVFGNEHEGVSEMAASLSDGNFLIPQVGMIRSLNISVACAISVYEAFRQRVKKGCYKEQRIPDEQYQTLLSDWSEK